MSTVRVDTTDRKPWYGDNEQPWDTIVMLGWGPVFAAGNVLKYLRRTKDREHSLESARWYWTRLCELHLAGSPDARVVVGHLHVLLTEDEFCELGASKGD